ncbi:MAG TPA: sigma-70 family RNA polymerase sigma factor, partial [Planctomycetaceae bacterium]|nr:sigma-70 family RNA polymerase sigma factor [Planctomycetaceae bacterium]
MTELITRHAALVRGVCQRLLGNSADADDAFQATFVVLIRKGEVLRVEGSLAGWLYAVAYRIARRQRRERSRAIALLQEGDVMTESDPLSELSTRHDVAVFETELARLPEKYRTPILLHHLEGKSQREVALELKVTEDAVDGRLKRGRNELRTRLARRGIVFGVTIAVLQKTQGAMAATPLEPLINATCHNLLSLDPVHHSALPPTAATHLARQEIHSMGLQQFTKMAGWTLLAGLLVGAAGLAISSERGDLPLREVQGKQDEQQVRQRAEEAIVALAGDPEEPANAAPAAEKPAPQPEQPAAEEKPRLNALLEQKLKLMRDGVDVASKLYQQRRIELQEVIQWKMDLHKTELEAC